MQVVDWQEIVKQLKKAQVTLGPSARLIQDSRHVQHGDVFIAVKGTASDGAAFISSALAQGAVAVLVSSNSDASLYQAQANVVVVNDLEDKLASLCQQFYRNYNASTLVGITGTNGKTSISHLLAQLSQIRLGQAWGVIGTMGVGSIQSLQAINNTTPGICDVYRLLDDFADDYQGVAMEVSSHALEQGRVDGLEFEVAVFTNLSLDHLDYHGTMAAYFAAKAKLFTEHKPAVSIINVDDEYGLQLAKQIEQNQRIIAYGQGDDVKSFQEYVFIAGHQAHTHGLSLNLEWRVSGQSEHGDIQLPIFGEFNGLNVAAVFATAQALSWPIQLADFTRIRAVPGRLELFVKPNLPIAVVDYAHTPDALEQSLKAVSKHLSGRLFVVFGCGGDRDKSKRAIMGEIAARLADVVIVTNDNPRTESPEAIAEQIVQGIGTKPHQVILDRKDAIRAALSQANDNDVVLIAGKGHETYQVIGTQSIDYNEREFVESLLSNWRQA